MNLRKDHCRNLQKQTANTSKTTPGPRRGGDPPPRPRSRNVPTRGPRGLTNSGAECAKENANGASPSPPSPVRGARRGERDAYRMSKRLSATDISALASMKNVAKCDTWCELQNPVNHRVFERKLRPKPLGRGHVCLGVTHRVAPPQNPKGRAGAEIGPPCERTRARGRPKCESAADARRDQWWLNPQLSCCRAPMLRRSGDTIGTQRRASSRSAPTTATPGQAGSPAEFKHINKRRKRNLQGFP